MESSGGRVPAAVLPLAALVRVERAVKRPAQAVLERYRRRLIRGEITRKQIAIELNCTYSTTLVWIPACVGSGRRSRLGEFLPLAKAGLHAGQIGAQCGVTAECVRLALKKAGLKARDGRLPAP